MHQLCMKDDPCDNNDRISGLPSNLTNNILERLPIRDLMRTSILSRKWRYLWGLVPRLDFGNNFFEKCKNFEYPRTSDIISDILLLHSGPIYKFTLHIPTNHRIKMECINKWIVVLSKKGIKDLELINLQTDPHQMPSCLFFCQELTFLELYNFKVSIPSIFDGFKTLMYLHLSFMRFKFGALENLMLGCQSLVELTISHCFGFEHINIYAPTLQVLYIEGDEVIKSICLKQAQKLIDLTLLANRPGVNFERNMASDLIRSLQKIQKLVLDTRYIEFLFAGIDQQVLLKLVNELKFLQLNGINFNEAGEVLFVISLIKSSPNLEKLVIKSNSMAVGPQHILNDFDCVDYCFCQLQTVNITVKTAYTHALNLIQFVLANSSSLEILTFKVGLGLSQLDVPTLLNISHCLLQMKRASSRAEVKLLHDGLIE